jgi:hypothetical protein
MEILIMGRERHYDRSKRMLGFKRNYQQALESHFLLMLLKIVAYVGGESYRETARIYYNSS